MLVTLTPPIDQTSFRTKGTVAVFGLTKLKTKECIFTQLLIFSLAGYRGDERVG